MKRVFLAFVFAVAAVAPLAAQTSQIGFLAGGLKRLNDLPGSQGIGGIKDFTFSNSVREVYYATQLDPGTYFELKVGQLHLPVAVSTSAAGSPTLVKGTIDHIDALVDYRFSEPFGSTGIFAGVGMYRTSAEGVADDTNVGLSGGLAADLPISRRYGIVGQATYHWVRAAERQRFVTLTGGLRISF